MLGFQHIQSILLTAHQNNKLHHAILLHGKKGIGKSNFAKNIACEILQNKNPNNPDLLIIEKEEDKKEIPVAKIRKIANFLNQTSAISPYKFIIIDAADELNKSSANALLKTLEEPHPNNFLILISHNPNKVMATIKSRCQSIKVPDLTRDDFIKIILDKDPDLSEDQVDFLSHICDNSPAKAIHHGQDLIDIYDLFLESLKKKIIDPDLQKKIADKKFSFDIISEILDFFINRLIKFLHHTENNFYFDEKEVFINLQNKLTMPEIFDISDDIKHRLQRNKSLNLDKKLTFINVFNQLVT